MQASTAWDRIVRAIRCTSVYSSRLDSFQKLIRRRYRKKNYGSFRIPEYEDILLQDKALTFLYAKCIVVGKLPERMHRMALAWAIADPNDPLVREYFDVCEGKRTYTRPSWMT